MCSRLFFSGFLLSFDESGSRLALFLKFSHFGFLLNPGVFNKVSNWMLGTQIVSQPCMSPSNCSANATG